MAKSKKCQIFHLFNGDDPKEFNRLLGKFISSNKEILTFFFHNIFGTIFDRVYK